jgi:hypothetical protein
MIDITNDLVQDALTIYAEAVQYVKEQKASRAFSVLHDGGGSFTDALQSDEVPEATKQWLYELRSALCSDSY